MIIKNTLKIYYTAAACLSTVERTFFGKAIFKRLKISTASSEISEQYQRLMFSLSIGPAVISANAVSIWYQDLSIMSRENWTDKKRK